MSTGNLRLDRSIITTKSKYSFRLYDNSWLTPYPVHGGNCQNVRVDSLYSVMAGTLLASTNEIIDKFVSTLLPMCKEGAPAKSLRRLVMN